jgi:hypothetical protein
MKFLPLESDICLARILTFGYNATFHKAGNVTTSILDFAKDLLFELKYAKDENQEDLGVGKVPLIFVVHSMGGLIVKEVSKQSSLIQTPLAAAGQRKATTSTRLKKLYSGASRELGFRCDEILHWNQS